MDTNVSALIKVEFDENNRVTMISAISSFCKNENIDELSEVLSQAIATQEFVAMNTTMDESIAQLENFCLPLIAELMADPTPPQDTLPRPNLPVETLKKLAEELTSITLILTLPQQPIESTTSEFCYLDRAWLTHWCDQILAVRLDKTWAKSAALQTLSDNLNKAVEVFYAERDSRSVENTQEKPKEYQQLMHIMAELGLTERNWHGQSCLTDSWFKAHNEAWNKFSDEVAGQYQAVKSARPDHRSLKASLLVDWIAAFNSAADFLEKLMIGQGVKAITTLGDYLEATCRIYIAQEAAVQGLIQNQIAKILSDAR